jgi:hypothetical protein
MNVITNLRENYRIKLDSDSSDHGIAMFDLVGSFVGAYYLKDQIVTKDVPDVVYYSLVIPIASFIHFFIGQDTFLNEKLYSSPFFNNYQIVFYLLIAIAFYYSFFRK